jgi:hypothetical protein
MWKQTSIVALWAFGSATLTYLGANLASAEAVGWAPLLVAAVNTGAYAAWQKLQETWKPFQADAATEATS